MYETDRTQLAQLAQFLAPFSDMNKKPTLTNVSNFLTVAVGWVALPLEALSRWEFGERYMSMVRIALAFTPQLIALWVMSSYGNSPGPFFVPFLLLAFAACMWHRFRIWQRNRAGIEWHSISTGISHLEGRLPGSDWAQFRFVEPGLWFGLSLLVSLVDDTTGPYLTIASLALFIHHQLIYGCVRDRQLDEADARIEAAYRSAAEEGRRKRYTAGMPRFVVATPAMPTPWAAATGATEAATPPASQNIASTVQAMMSEAPSVTPAGD